MKLYSILSVLGLLLSVGVLSAADQKQEPVAKKDGVAKVEKDVKDAKDAKKPTTRPVSKPAVASKPVNKFCAVEQEHEADPKVVYTYKEKVYAFCCKDCIDEFKKNPEKYKNAK